MREWSAKCANHWVLSVLRLQRWRRRIMLMTNTDSSFETMNRDDDASDALRIVVCCQVQVHTTFPFFKSAAICSVKDFEEDCKLVVVYLVEKPCSSTSALHELFAE